MKRIGIIGSGNIGMQIIQAVENHAIPDAVVVAVMSRSPEKIISSLSQRVSQNISVCTSTEALIAAQPDIVVEAAHPSVVQDCACAVLNAGVDFMPMSVGGLIISGVLEKLTKLAKESDAQLIVPAGAITGLNVASSAVALSTKELYEAMLTSTKNPSSLKNAPFFIYHPEVDIASIRKAQLIFEGNVLDAVKNFPQNVNIAATLALCGIGAEKTKVRMIADPETTKTKHEVSLKGAFGETHCTLKLEMSPNKHSSYLAALSGIATLKKYCSPIKLDY